MNYTIPRHVVDLLMPLSFNYRSAGFAFAVKEICNGKGAGECSGDASSGGVVLRRVDVGKPLSVEAVAPSLAPPLRVESATVLFPGTEKEIEQFDKDLGTMTGYVWEDKRKHNRTCVATAQGPGGLRVLRFKAGDVINPGSSCLIPVVIQSNADPLVPLPAVLADLEPLAMTDGVARGVRAVACPNGLYVVKPTRPKYDLDADERRRALEDFSSVRFIAMPEAWDPELPQRLAVSRPLRDAVVLRPERQIGESRADGTVEVGVKEVTLSRDCLLAPPGAEVRAASYLGFKARLAGEMDGYQFLEQPMTDWHRCQYTQRYTVDIASDGEGSQPAAGHKRVQLRARKGVSAALTCEIYHPRLRQPKDTETHESLLSAMTKIVVESVEAVVAETLGRSCPSNDEDVEYWTEILSRDITTGVTAASLFDGGVTCRVHFECIETDGPWLQGCEDDAMYRVPTYATRRSSARMLVELAVMSALGVKAEFFPWGSSDVSVTVPV